MRKEKYPKALRKLLASPSTKETCAGPLILTPSKASLLTTRIIPTSEKKWTVIHACSPDGGPLAVSFSKKVTTMLRHFDKEERQTGGSRHWDSIKPVLMRAFAREGAQDFSDKNWLRLIHEGSTRKRLENCTHKDGNLMLFQSFSGTPWWYTNKSRIDEIHAYSIQMEGVQSFLGSGIILEREKKDRTPQAVFLTPLNPFGKDPEEEKPHFDYTVPQKVPCETPWKYDQDAVKWVRLSKVQDQGLQFWQTKSFAIMVYATIPGDCIYRVIAQNRDRVIFERLATPRPAPKITLKRNWRSQQQQQEQQL